MDVCVVTYRNGPERITAALRPSDRLYVRDNTHDNIGFGAAANGLARLGSQELILFVNPDGELAPGALDALELAFDDPNVVAAEAAQGPEHDRPSLTPGGDMEWLSGACVAVRRRAFETVGGFDERLFMYSEDVDLSYRLRPLGRLLHVPTARFIHDKRGGQSFPMLHCVYRNALVIKLRYSEGTAPQVSIQMLRDAIGAARMARPKHALGRFTGMLDFVVRAHSWASRPRYGLAGRQPIARTPASATVQPTSSVCPTARSRQHPLQAPPSVSIMRTPAVRDLISRGVRPVVRRGARTLNVALTPKGYYSPIPDVAKLDSAIWERPSPTPGIDWRSDTEFEFVERTLAKFVGEFQPRGTPSSNPTEYYLDNGNYGPVDAELLYAMIRELRPRRILELGAGYSTLVIASACRSNRTEGSPPLFVSADPFPASFLSEDIDGVDQFLPLGAREVDRALFASLAQNDILFVDTTHTVKTGSEVNHLILDVLPTLKAGVVVHFHDIFLPWEYPRIWLEEYHYYWAEQYLLQALLVENPRFQIVLAAHNLCRIDAERLRRTVPSLDTRRPPTAFWLRRC